MQVHPYLFFEGRTEELALAWALLFLMGERGEIGVRGPGWSTSA